MAVNLTAAAKTAFDEIKASIEAAVAGNGALKGATFYESSIINVNLRYPAIIVMERTIEPVEQTFLWGVARLRLRIDVIASQPDREQNLARLENVMDALLELFWANRQLNGKARETYIEQISIGETEARPDQTAASLSIGWDVEFQRPL